MLMSSDCYSIFVIVLILKNSGTIVVILVTHTGFKLLDMLVWTLYAEVHEGNLFWKLMRSLRAIVKTKI